MIAVVFLAIYLGIVQMGLLFFGLTLFIEPTNQTEALAQIGAIYITFFALVPFLLFAVYRARRYRYARTRWRGIRFGMEKGAWGYVWRAILHYLLTGITFGIMLPRQSFFLEKYMTDRSWFGDAKFTQEGKWTKLYPAMKHVLIGIAIMVVGGIVGALTEAPALLGIAIFVGYIWLLIGSIYYFVRSFAYMTSNKVIDGNIRFVSDPRTGFVIKTYVVGMLIIGIGAGIGLAVLGAIGVSMFTNAAMGGAGSMVGAVVIVVLYVLILLMIGAAAIALITQPIIAHMINTIRIENVDAVAEIQQRAADQGADAEGFADALDIGGAI